MRTLLAALGLTLALAAPAQAAVTLELPAPFVAANPAVVIASDPDATLQCRVGDGDFAPCASPWTPAVAQDGTYAYEVTATAGDGSTATRQSSFVLDRTAPVIAIDGGRIVVTDANIDHAECTFDGGAYAPCPESLPDGVTSYAVHAVDLAGNEASLSSATPTVSAPDVRGPEGGILGTSAEQVKAKVVLSAKRTRAWTRLRRLELTHVPAGIAVTASCHGGGCPQHALKRTAHGGAVSLKGLTACRLKPGAVITIALRRDGKLLQTLHVTIRRSAGPRVR